MRKSIHQNIAQCTFDFVQPLPTKQCDTCLETKPLTSFSRDRQHQIRTWCKVCAIQYRCNKKTIAPPKQCISCLETKPSTDFGKNRRYPDKLQPSCKVCLHISRYEKRRIVRPATKECDTCHETKPLTAFGRNRRQPDKKQTRCKVCFKRNTWNKKQAPTPDQTKECNTCHETKPLAEFASDGGARLRFGVRNQCKACDVVPRKEYNVAHPGRKYQRTYDPKKNREGKIRKKFNLTTAQYDEMFARQNGVCALCGMPETAIDPRTRKVRYLAIDHCHVTGTVRQLLCQRCNMMLGFAKDDTELLRRAADYVERHR